MTRSDVLEEVGDWIDGGKGGGWLGTWVDGRKVLEEEGMMGEGGLKMHCWLSWVDI